MKMIRKILKEIIPVKFLEERGFFYKYNKKEIEKLRNKFSGERCFIIGNGPSLNKIDLNLIKNEYTFGVNGIFYKESETGFKPTFYVVEDNHVIDDNISKINDFDCEYKLFPIEYKPKIKNLKNTIFFNLNRSFYEKRSENFQIPQFSFDCAERVFGLGSVTMANLQLAYFMGFKEVYLIGMDFSYTIPESAIVDGLDITSTDDDVNHFHPDYFGKGKKWHDPNLEQVLKSYKHMKEVYESGNRKIYNATVGGKLEVFDRKYFKDLF
jgi:hypothetical protein